MKSKCETHDELVLECECKSINEQHKDRIEFALAALHLALSTLEMLGYEIPENLYFPKKNQQQDSSCSS